MAVMMNFSDERLLFLFLVKTKKKEANTKSTHKATLSVMNHHLAVHRNETKSEINVSCLSKCVLELSSSLTQLGRFLNQQIDASLLIILILRHVDKMANGQNVEYL